MSYYLENRKGESDPFQKLVTKFGSMKEHCSGRGGGGGLFALYRHLRNSISLLLENRLSDFEKITLFKNCARILTRQTERKVGSGGVARPQP